MRTAFAILQALDVKAAPAAAPPDIAKVAKPAPGASPVGAFAFMEGDDGTQAWLVKEGDGPAVGYLRDSDQPERAIQIDDAEAWAQIVDQLGLQEQAVPAADATDQGGAPADAQAPATPDGQDGAAPAAAGQEAPAAKAPAPDVKPEGKAAPGGQVVAPDDYEEQTGIMVALIVPEGDAKDLVVDHQAALDWTELHITLAYLGKTDEIDDEGAYYANVLEALRDVAAEYEALTGVISGVGRFSIPGDSDAFYYSFDAPELPDLRHDLVEALEEAGIDVSHEHGFTPHITVAYIKEGEENPIRRATTAKVLTFDALVFCYGDQRLRIRLGGTDPDEADAAFNMEAGRPGSIDSTAPSAMPDEKAKPNPFAKGGKKGGPPIATGAWVSWGNQRGRVDLVVTNGKVPGVEQDITGTKDKPAARVVVYEQAGKKWKATGKKVGVSASSLKRSFPLTGGFGKKDLDVTDPEAALVDILTGYYEGAAEAKDLPYVDPAAVWTVYGRGVESWPGEHTGVSNEAWGLGRTKAFLTVAAGGDVPGYESDRDLLPEGHALAVKTAPVLVVDESDGNQTTGGATVTEVGEPGEKVAATVMQGSQFVGVDEVTQTIARLRALLA